MQKFLCHIKRIGEANVDIDREIERTEERFGYPVRRTCDFCWKIYYIYHVEETYPTMNTICDILVRENKTLLDDKCDRCGHIRFGATILEDSCCHNRCGGYL